MIKNKNIDSMHKVNLADPEWYRAAALTERVKLLKASGTVPSAKEANSDLVEERLKRWREELTFSEDRHFDERLKMDGISLSEFKYFLGEPAEAIKARYNEPPEWLEKLAKAFNDPNSFSKLPMPSYLQGEGSTGFLYVAGPLIRQGLKRLHQGIKKLGKSTNTLASYFDDSTKVDEYLLPNLYMRLLSMLSRTMVLELNVAREQGFLNGGSPEERFQDFVERLCDKEEALSILREYPVLARQLVVGVDQWVDTSLELLRHLCEDWDDIRRTFCPADDPGDLAELESGMGDQHRGGRSVHILTFNSGFRLVYKPRSLAVDSHFQELLVWLNKRGDHPSFRALKILATNDTHGWVEYVETHGCTSEEEVERFYQRQGGYLALLYALHATDFHYENLIASGEHPILVDLEALFHPSGQEGHVQGAEYAASALDRSVLITGMLPQRIWADLEHEGVDISGLGGAAGQLSPDRLPYWEEAATDEMRLARKRVEMGGSKNRPSLNDDEVDMLRYKEDIVEGFAKVYRLLVRYQDKLVSNDGPLNLFGRDEVRYIARATRTYESTLLESFHPDLLRDALRRDRFFDRLWVSSEADFKTPNSDPKLARVFPSEREDLQKGDIPVFTTRPNSRDLWSTSSLRVTNYFDNSVLTLAQQRIGELNEEDLARQAWIIRASFTALTIGEGRAAWPLYGLPEPKRQASEAELLDAATRIGERIEFLALRGDQDINWLGLTFVNERVWALTPLSAELYSGLSGVAIFLGYLGDITGEERYTELAELTVKAIQNRWKPAWGKIQAFSDLSEALQGSELDIGAFGEIGGSVYSLTHLGTIWDDSTLLSEAEKLTELLSALVEEDKNFDVLGGAAGCINILLSLHSCRPSDRLLGIARRCGDHLIVRSRSVAAGIGWDASMSEKPLSGFSHGAAGIAYALSRLAVVTGERRYKEAALKAVAYERSTFSADEGNWRDLRDIEELGMSLPQDAEDDLFMTTWCHGAPGIGLARLKMLDQVTDSAIYDEINLAVQATFKEGFGINHSMCHGALGNLELPLEAGRLLQDTELLSKTYRTAAAVLQSMGTHGYLCGVPSGVETPGFMMGLSGIGYGLLRLAKPEYVPSVLTLDPPLTGGQHV